MVGDQLLVYADPDRCIECWACQVACKQWHGFAAGTLERRRVVERVTGVFPDVVRSFYSLSCAHCDDPACVGVCPASAIEKRAEDGIVVVDRAACIGCHYCYYACPFGIPRYDEGGMDKCDLCLSLGVGEDGRPCPRCVQTCPVGALYFGTPDEIRSVLDEKAAVMRSSGVASLVDADSGLLALDGGASGLIGWEAGVGAR